MVCMSEITQSDMNTIGSNEDNLYEEDLEYQESLLKKFVTFRANKTLFGVDAIDVIEIMTNCNIRKIPKIPSFIKGVINFRGEVLPIMDLSCFLSNQESEESASSCVIIIRKDNLAIGLMVEEVLQVREVFLYGKKDIPTSEIVKITSSIIKLDDGVVMLVLDIDKLLRIKTGLC